MKKLFFIIILTMGLQSLFAQLLSHEEINFIKNTDIDELADEICDYIFDPDHQVSEDLDFYFDLEDVLFEFAGTSLKERNNDFEKCKAKVQLLWNTYYSKIYCKASYNEPGPIMYTIVTNKSRYFYDKIARKYELNLFFKDENNKTVIDWLEQRIMKQEELLNNPEIEKKEPWKLDILNYHFAELNLYYNEYKKL